MKRITILAKCIFDCEKEEWRSFKKANLVKMI